MSPFMLGRDANGQYDFGIPLPADHIYTIKLAAATKNTFTIPNSADGNARTGNPTGAWITSDVAAWVALGATLSIPGANVVDGSGAIYLLPGWPRYIVIPAGTTQMSMISTPAGFASVEWHDGKL